MKKLVIFDMDGTLADTSEGIFNSIRYTQKMLNLPEITYAQMLSHVGPPMEESYARNFGLSGESLKKAVQYHKEYAMKKGYRELKVYDGIIDLLEKLRNAGIRTAVATLKAQTTAEKIAKEYFPDLFDVVIGANQNNPMTKAEMLLKCIDKFQFSKDDAVLVGDSIYDADGAAEAGIDFVAVTYGFGFQPNEDISANHIVVVDNPKHFNTENYMKNI